MKGATITIVAPFFMLSGYLSTYKLLFARRVKQLIQTILEF